MSAALRLHGYPVSNYVNIVRAALIEKDLPFTFIQVRAGRDEAFLHMNPMGKIPVLETPHGCLGETVAILDYLDDAYPDRALRPADPFARARGRQLINIIQLYVEAQARTLFPGVFMGGDNTPPNEQVVRAMLDRSTAALTRLCAPAPFLLGHALSQADLFAFYNLGIADRVTRFVYGRSLIEEIGSLGPWQTEMAARESSRIVLADFETCFASYLVEHKAAYAAAPANGLSSHA